MFSHKKGANSKFVLKHSYVKNTYRITRLDERDRKPRQGVEGKGMSLSGTCILISGSTLCRGYKEYNLCAVTYCLL